MATISEDYVSFETAKLFKDKGFQQIQDNCGYFTTEMIYSINVDDNGEHHFAHQYPAGVYNKDKYIAAPTLQMAMKWLREVHNINIDIVPIWNQKRFEYQVFVITPENAKHCYIDDELYLGYEQACDVAIRYCLENLI